MSKDYRGHYCARLILSAPFIEIASSGFFNDSHKSEVV